MQVYNFNKRETWRKRMVCFHLLMLLNFAHLRTNEPRMAQRWKGIKHERACEVYNQGATHDRVRRRQRLERLVVVEYIKGIYCPHE